MSSWQFDPITLTILNVNHGAWTLPLKEVTNSHALAHWILQAAKHDFDIAGLMQAFLEAGQYCFDSQEVNGATMLQMLFNTSPRSRPSTVNWISGTVA